MSTKHITYEEFYSLDISLRNKLATARELAEITGYTSVYISAMARAGKIKPMFVVSLNGRSKRPLHLFDREKVLAFFQTYNNLSRYKEKEQFVQSYWES